MKIEKRTRPSRKDFIEAIGIVPSMRVFNAKTKPDLLKYEKPIQIEYLDHIRFDVQYESHGRWIPAYLLWPKKNSQGLNSFSKQKLPGVVLSHYHGSAWLTGRNAMIDESNMQTEALGLDLVRRGYVVLIPDILGFGKRVELSEQDEERRKGEVGYATMLAAYNLHGDNYARHVIQDTIRAIDVLCNEEGVNKSRIALVGYSFGGHISTKTSALDQRVYATVAFNAVANIRTKIALNRKIDPTENIHGLLQVGDTDDMLRLIAPRALLISNSSNDPYTPHPTEVYNSIKGEWECRRVKNKIACFADYETKHELSVKMKDDAFNWLDSIMCPKTSSKAIQLK